MTEREKTAHVLRRFGLGAGRAELARYEKLGWEKTLDALLGESKTDEKFPVSPYEFVAQPKGNLEPNSGNMANWWALRLVMSRRPMTEKLTVFWHDHFALDAEKVGEAPTMLGYLDVLRKHGKAKFRDLLHAVVKQGALLVYLDNHTSNRIHPNENFARELFELFTLGIGNYTEQDVKEAARAFTGWSVHYLGTGQSTKYDQLRERATRNKLSLYNFCDCPAIHDDGVKTVLGKTGRWTGDDVLDIAARHPATAKFVCTKLWTFFATPEPDPRAIEGLIKVWQKTDGDIAAVLRAIAQSKEFWSASCVRQMPKSPLDFTVSLFRNLDLGPTLLTLRGEPFTEFTPMKKEVRDAGSNVNYLMRRQGLHLLFPPNVNGWDWGAGWITAQNVVYRLQHANQLFASGGKDRPLAVKAATLAGGTTATTEMEFVQGLADVLDAPLSQAMLDRLAAECTAQGGLAALKNPAGTAKVVARLAHLMFAVPEFQLC